VFRARTLRLLPAALAAYELRCLVFSLIHVVRLAGSETLEAGSASMWLVALLALGAGLLLLQMGRGLSQVGVARRWRPRVAGVWLVGCSAALVMLCALRRSPPHGGELELVGSAGAGWGPVVAAAGLSLLLAVSLEGGGWLLRAAARLKLAPGYDAGRVADQRPPTPARLTAAPAPLLAGWSGRGPPRGAPATV
jgi:hypothetical protein